MKYVIVTDPEGATVGYDGPFVPITHAMVIDKAGQISGFESICKLFDSYRAFASLASSVAKQAVGTVGVVQAHRALSWSVIEQ